MRYISLDKRTLLSKIGIGTYKNFGEKLDRRESQKLIIKFHQEGVNFIDSSVNYVDGNCEKLIGEILKKNYLRKNFFIASKVFFSVNKKIKDGLSKNNIKYSLDQIKKNYQTDFIDCLQCHRYDPNINLHELVDIFEELIKKGEIRFWGSTNWPEDKIIKVQKICRMKKKFLFNQQPLNIFFKKKVKNLINTKNKGIVNLVYGILSKGLLSDKFLLNQKQAKFKKNINYKKKNVSKIKKLKKVCTKYGYSLEEFMFALANSKKYVDITLCGISSIKHLNKLEFKKIFNNNLFIQHFNEMKKYEDIKNIL